MVGKVCYEVEGSVFYHDVSKGAVKKEGCLQARLAVEVAENVDGKWRQE